MKTYSQFYTSYTIGIDAISHLADRLKGYGKNIAIIGGETALKCALPKVNESLSGTEFKIVNTITHKGESSHFRMDTNIELLKDVSVDIIIGIGGGKAIDTAKGVAFKMGLPVFSLPTIASTCASTSALSVVYKEDGEFEEIFEFGKPPIHSFIDLQIIADAPDSYLRAGMGDTIGKRFECQFAARGDELKHGSRLGKEVSNLCYDPLLLYGEKALKDCKCNVVSNELLEAVLAIIVSTGMVSISVEDRYNSAVAHATYYGLVNLPGFEEHYLHGDVVAYGVLVQLAIDNNLEDLVVLKEFLDKIEIITSLESMDVKVDKEYLKDILPAIVNGPDMQHIPYEITEDMILDGMKIVETYKK